MTDYNHSRRIRIAPKIKAITLKQQEYACAICGTDLRDRVFHMDHVIPLSRGGTNHYSNLQVVCPGCNYRKGVMLPEEMRDNEVLDETVPYEPDFDQVDERQGIDWAALRRAYFIASGIALVFLVVFLVLAFGPIGLILMGLGIAGVVYWMSKL